MVYIYIYIHVIFKPQKIYFSNNFRFLICKTNSAATLTKTDVQNTHMYLKYRGRSRNI